MKSAAIVALLTVLALGGCASASSTLPGDSALTYSDVCSTSVIAEPAPDVQGAATRTQAVGEILDWYKGELARQEAAKSESSDQPPFPSDDPVRLFVVVRGLSAVLDEIGGAEKSLAPDDPLSAVAYLGEVQIADAMIVHLPSGGYAVDSFSTSGFTSDDPKCTASGIEGSEN